ncbi:hypothetical protein GGI20_001616 [Coemansia sp. BCRC 34301]|nr:hypothetical protein GGI20_001616 [Coemansia sp. BCRC 34301]
MPALGAIIKLSAISALLASTGAVLQGCSKTIALEVTNIFENGDPSFHYDYCEDINDGRGYTSGIAGFCTGTSDAWLVVQEYHNLTGGKDKMSQFDAVLAEYSLSGNSSTFGLANYCSVWRELSTSDIKFKQAQDTIRDSMYLSPAMALAKQLGLGTSIAHGQLYDAAIQHGAGDGPDGLGGMIKATNARVTADKAYDSGSTLVVNGYNIDEIAWLKMFLDVRLNVLTNPQEPPNMSGAWAKTLYRVKSYEYALDSKQYNWASTAIFLDNDGQPTVVTCTEMRLTSTAPKQRRGMAGLAVACLVLAFAILL